VGDHLWLRVLDVTAALEARRYNAPGTFVLELQDPLGFADGRWMLHIDETGVGTVRELADGEGNGGSHQLAMNVRDLGAVYLGATSISTLVKAGRIDERTAGAATAADAAFRSTTTPWLSTWF
jgi:predicted acetyltransferase